MARAQGERRDAVRGALETCLTAGSVTGADAPAPEPGPIGIRALLTLRDARRRWPFAARAGLCMGVPVVLD